MQLSLISRSSSYGGSRSFIASKDLPPGTLLMKEYPLYTWKREQVGAELDVTAVEGVIAKGNVKSLDNLHPVKIDDLPKEAVDKVKARHRSAVNSLSSTSGLSPDAIFRLLFTFSCNAYDSGLYGYFSIFNHSESPNCMKFSPTDDRGYSEVRTVRAVKEGEGE